MTNQRKIALLSVYSKEGIVDFARELIALGYHIIASGGTKRVLAEVGLAVSDVAELAGGEAILGHRVVTISREIAAGLLADDHDQDELKRLGIPRIDLVCVDMYPLAQAVARPEATLASVRESTDIGGPLMLRAAAKGARVVVCEEADRQRVISWLKAGEPERDSFIRELAAKAESIASGYALKSASYLSGGSIDGYVGTKIADCLYGENPWMNSPGLFQTDESRQDPLALANFTPVAGTTASYNNYVDLDRCLQTVTHISAAFAVNFSDDTPGIAIGVKHGNPCGAAVGSDPLTMLRQMVAGNPLAIFGGVVLTTAPVGAREAEILLTHGMEEGRKRVLDMVVAPNFSEDAIELLARKKTQKCRMLTNPALAHLNAASLDTATRRRYVRGGFLAQSNYTHLLDRNDTSVQVHGEVSEAQWRDAVMAWAVGATSNSNTITFVKDGQVIANGVGQQARVIAAKLAVMLARDSGHEPRGSVCYSDSFFPFTDAPQVLYEAGVRAIVTSGGSVADADVIAYCKEKNMTLITMPDKEARGFFGH